MAIPTPGVDRNGFLLSESKGMRSRKSANVTSSGTAIKSGTVMVATSRPSAVAAAIPGTHGNGVMGTVTVTGPVKPGMHRLVITAASANAGAFSVYDPDGLPIGSGGNVASAFSGGGLAFTLADGSVDFAVGDEVHINVNVGESTYTPYAGSGSAAAILYNDVPSVPGTYEAVLFVRDCEVARPALIGLDGAAETALEALGIIVCGVYTK